MHQERNLAWLHRRLKECVEQKDVEGGREVQNLITAIGLHLHPLLAPLLIRLCVLAGQLQAAQHIFDSLPQTEASSWHAIVHAYSKLGPPTTTISLFQQMLHRRVESHPHAFAAALKACTQSFSLDRGIAIHAHIVESGFEEHEYLSSALVDMYSKCRRLQDARSMFNRCSIMNTFSFTALISGLVQEGQCHEALALFVQMQQQGQKPTHVTYVCVLKACSTGGALILGRVCHAQLIEGNEFCVNEVINSVLIDMYGKCETVEDAQVVFNAMPVANVAAWTALIMGHSVRAGHLEVLRLFQQMLQEGIEPDAATYIVVLSACLNPQAVFKGQFIHCILSNCSHGYDAFVQTALVHMYTKCGNLQEARRVFDRLSKLDVVIWSSILEAYAERGDAEEVFILFTLMQEGGMNPDKVLFGSLLKVCTKISALDWGRYLHSMILEYACETDMVVAGSIVNMYSKCGGIDDAHRIFSRTTKPNMVMWTALLSGYAQAGCYKEVFSLFLQMQTHGQVPDNVAFAAILKACSKKGLLRDGELLHEQALQQDGVTDAMLAGSLVSYYATGGKFEDALAMFDNLGIQQTSVWNALISGFCEHGYCEAVLLLFQHMRQQGVEVDIATYILVLKCCTEMAALEQGKFVHAQMDQKVCEVDCFLANTLIDMYFKCGCCLNAELVFNRLAVRDVAVWTSMIAGYGENSDYHTALQYFNLMLSSGLNPNDSTFVSMLCACSNRGLIDEGCQHLELMRSKFNITPTFDHYNCMADLYGRVGCLHEAIDLLLTMPAPPNLIAWMSVLSHSTTHGRTEVGRMCYENLVLMDKNHASSYELMLKLYVDDGQLKKAREIQEQRKHAHVQKKVGVAFIETNNKVSKFLAGGDEEHEQSVDLRWILQTVRTQMRGMGFVPFVDSVLPPDDAYNVARWYGIPYKLGEYINS